MLGWKLGGRIGPQRTQRCQLNSSDSIDQLAMLGLASFRIFGRVLVEPSQEVGDPTLWNENGGSLNERLILCRVVRCTPGSSMPASLF
jgi:hypothetical protein